ncbi:hypothetical protein BDL97_06G133900 [Sphagnum fallax]|nr:hypothetical protein BDL97_06G133900 [Sphagnum fallax]
MEKGDWKGGCKWHPRKKGEGVCAWCLRESLIKLVASQGADEDNSSDAFEEKLDSKRIANGGRRKEGESHFPLVHLRRSKSACDGEAKKISSHVGDNRMPSKITRYGLKGLHAINFEGGRGEQESARASNVQNFHYSFSERKPNSQAPTSSARAKSSWKSAVSHISALKNAWGMFWKSEKGDNGPSPSHLKPEHETRGKLAAINGDHLGISAQQPSVVATDPSRPKRTSVGSRVSPWSSRASLLSRKSVSGVNSIQRSSNKESRAVCIPIAFQEFSQEHDIEQSRGISFDTMVVEESPRRSGFEGDQCVAYGRTLEGSCQNHNHNIRSCCALDAKQSLPQSSNKASPWRLFSLSSPRMQVQSDDPISMPNIFKTRISRSMSLQKPQVASPPLDSKQATGNIKPSPWSKTLSRSSSKWSRFSSNSKMKDEAAWFPEESPGRLKCVLHTQSASSSPYTSKAEAGKHSSRSSKTSPWSSSLSRPSSKASPLILSSNAQARDQRDKVLEHEALSYRLDPDRQIHQFLQSRSTHFQHEEPNGSGVPGTGDDDDSTLNPSVFQKLRRPTGSVQNGFDSSPLYKRHRSIAGSVTKELTGVWN